MHKLVKFVILLITFIYPQKKLRIAKIPNANYFFIFYFMKIHNIKTIEALKTLQIRAKALTKTLQVETVTILKGEQHIQVKSGFVYELHIKEADLLNKDFALIAKKVSKNLAVLLADDTIVVFDDYFEICMPDFSCLVVLPDEEGVYYVVEGNFPVLADGSQIVHSYGNKNSLSAIAATQSTLFFENFSSTNLLIIPLIAAVGGSSDDPTSSVTTATIHKVIDSVGGNAGTELSSGATTDDTNPELVGTVSAILSDNEHINIYDGALLLGQVTVTTNGIDWTYTDTRALVDGDKPSYTVKIIETVGTTKNEGAASPAFTLIIDTAPSSPIDLALAAGDDTGIDGDNITSKATVTINGKAESGSIVTFFNGNTLLGKTTANQRGDFSWGVTLAENLTHNITAKATDATGNTSDASETLDITIDTTALIVKSKTEGVMVLGNDLKITFNEMLIKGVEGIVVRNENGTQFEEVIIADTNTNANTGIIRMIANIVGNTNATINGKTLTIELKNDLVQGNSYYVELEEGVLKDIAYNHFIGMSGKTAWVFKIADLSTTVLWSGINDGYINTSELAEVTLSGVVENPDNTTNLTLAEIKFVSSDGGATYVIDNGLPAIIGDKWTLTNNDSWTQQLTSGKTYAVEVKLSGVLTTGKVNGSGVASSMVVDTVAPVKPTIDTVATDDIINITEQGVVITGATEAGSSVTLNIANVKRVATVVETIWRYMLVADDIANMGQGNKNIMATATDTAGNTSDSNVKVITIDTIAPIQPIINIIATDNIINIAEQGMVEITGTTEVGSSVTLNIANEKRVALVTGTTWRYTLVATDIANMKQGHENIIATTSDTAGNTSNSDIKVIIIDTLAPTKPTINTIATDDVINIAEQGVMITGTTEVGSSVTLNIANEKRAAIVTEGTWRYTLVEADIANMRQGNENITATAMDTAGNASDSDVKVIIVDIINPIITSKTTGAIAPSSHLIATFDETIVKGTTGNIIIKDSADNVFETINISDSKITIDGVNNKILTIKTTNDLVADTSYYIQIEKSALADAAGNNFAGISGKDWTFKVANLSTTVLWFGTNVNASDGYISTSELTAADISGVITNIDNVQNLTLTEIKFVSSDGSVAHIINSGLPTITDNNWTLTNNDSWANQLVSGKTYTVEVKLSGTLATVAVNGSGTASSVVVDTTITPPPSDTNTISISDDTGVSSTDHITNAKEVRVTLTLTNNLVLANDEKLQVSANDTDWVDAITLDNKTWATAGNAVTLIIGADKIITARIIDTAGNSSMFTLTDNDYTFDTTVTLPPDAMTGAVVISNDTGIVGDHITNDEKVKVTLTLTNDLTITNDEKLQVSANGTNWIEAGTLDNKTWTTADNAVTLIIGADKIITARIIDTAGNSSVLNLTNNNYLFDVMVTSPPSGTNTVAISDDTGVSSTDRITNNEKVKVTLTLTNNLILASDEKLQVSADNGITWIEATGNNKTWTTTEDAVTLAGTGTITARIIDTAGNNNALTLVNNDYILDVSAPTAPTITYISDDVGSIKINIAKDGKTDDTTLTVRVNFDDKGADAGSVVKLYNGADVIGTAMLTQSNITDKYIDISTDTLTDGITYAIKASVIDKAGNVGTLSVAHSITIDTTPPTKPTINTIATDDVINNA
ncbi:MAG: hypothetical protein FE834_01340, partial [Gammaproteobacteria bacterium]|nr:hypothetical protein [Gammaproteobacteria bacterium]